MWAEPSLSVVVYSGGNVDAINMPRVDRDIARRVGRDLAWHCLAVSLRLPWRIHDARQESAIPISGKSSQELHRFRTEHPRAAPRCLQIVLVAQILPCRTGADAYAFPIATKM
jgi:hypothetical protein